MNNSTKDDFDNNGTIQIICEVFEFITTQEHWSKWDSTAIAWGMLIPVFSVIFDLAPNEDEAIKFIEDVFAEFIIQRFGGKGDA